jgi:hypothetical protein
MKPPQKKVFLDMAQTWIKGAAKTNGDTVPLVMSEPRSDESSH